MRLRYALGIEYDGCDFLGWQRHPGGPTVQAAVEDALSYVADVPVVVICAGRTDAGVHAACQVIHFDSEAARDPRAWLLGSNTRLPGGVRTLWCRPMPQEFHARFSARARCYRYSLLNRPIPPAIQRRTLSWERLPLDTEAMHRAAQALVGEHDFSALRTAQCQAKHPRRDLHRIDVRRDGEQVTVEVQANAFLHHMVRNIVGSLVLIGLGQRSEDWIGELLAGRDRTVAGPTAAAAGLVFLGPKFPVEWGLPPEVTL